MRALSIQQPWAWLIVNGYKPIENRTWSTTFRGDFLIHAGLKIDKRSLAILRKRLPKIDFPDTFETGGIVGVATIVEVVAEWLDCTIKDLIPDDDSGLRQPYLRSLESR